MMAGDQPDHSAIIAEVARIGEAIRGVERRFDDRLTSMKDDLVRRLEDQDVHRTKVATDIDLLKTAHNVQVGKGAMAKTIYTVMAGGLGAGIIKLAEWLSKNGGAMPPPFPPGTPGAH